MAGAGYKLFNTGDVLTAAQVNTYLMEQSVMVFADAAARTTALSGVVAEGMLSYLKDTNAVEVYDGANWVASDDPNAIQNTIVDAKGDLVAASADNVPARLAVGNNGETLVADSSTTTGLRYQPVIATNPVINGAFDIWQRGTSLAVTNNVYTADRWSGSGGGGAGVSTFSRQTTNDTTNLPNIEYCARVQRDSGQTTVTDRIFAQNIENDNCKPFIGQSITLSFYARKGADYSSASNALTVRLTTGTGTNQNVFAGLTGANNAIDATATLTATWQRFSFNVTLSASITQFVPSFRYTPVGTAGAADYFEVTGVQIELGSVPTVFRRSGGTIAGELAACQRYYWRTTANGSNGFLPVGNGMSSSATAAFLYIKLPVSMRIYPSTVAQSGLCISDLVNYNLNLTNIAWTQSSPDMIQVEATHGTGATQYRPAFLRANNSSTAYLEVSAEL